MHDIIGALTYSALGDVGELVELSSGEADSGRDGDGDELHVDECWCWWW
jgi:hypothetical protein